MQKRSLNRSVVTADVIVHRVDPINRELEALIDGRLVTIDVPPQCDVILRGERVKLRLVQPRDRLRMTYVENADCLVACVIEVQPAYPSASLAR
jgi:hypothetical protein